MNPNKENEVKPCPWCGSTKITVEWEHCEPLATTDTNRRWFAECSQCCCQGPFCQKEPEVMPSWNTRAPITETEKSLLDWRLEAFAASENNMALNQELEMLKKENEEQKLLWKIYYRDKSVLKTQVAYSAKVEAKVKEQAEVIRVAEEALREVIPVIEAIQRIGIKDGWADGYTSGGPVEIKVRSALNAISQIRKEKE